MVRLGFWCIVGLSTTVIKVDAKSDISCLLQQAPVRIVATGSVLFGSSVLGVNAPPRFDQFCSGDDWDCYHVAQRNFLATLARHQRKDTCTVVITGDYHFHDLKARLLFAHLLPLNKQCRHPDLSAQLSVSAKYIDSSAVACICLCSLISSWGSAMSFWVRDEDIPYTLIDCSYCIHCFLQRWSMPV